MAAQPTVYVFVDLPLQVIWIERGGQIVTTQEVRVPEGYVAAEETRESAEREEFSTAMLQAARQIRTLEKKVRELETQLDVSREERTRLADALATKEAELFEP